MRLFYTYGKIIIYILNKIILVYFFVIISEKVVLNSNSILLVN